jgi:hypothetical protein
MDLKSTQAKQALNYEGIREVNVPNSQALEKTKEDGLKEVFFKAGDKEYVAYGKNLDVDKFKNSFSTTFEGAEVKIDFVDNEANTALEGTNKALKSEDGIAAKSFAAVAGAGIGLVVGAVAGRFAGGPVFTLVTAVSSAIITGIAMAKVTEAGVATAGAIKAGKKEADYQAVMQISSPVN